jgi:hypothetical protein
LGILGTRASVQNLIQLHGNGLDLPPRERGGADHRPETQAEAVSTGHHGQAWLYFFLIGIPVALQAMNRCLAAQR